MGVGGREWGKRESGGGVEDMGKSSGFFLGMITE